MYSKDLYLASKYFNRGKYSDVINLLEQKIVYYKDSALYFNLLGASCVFIGDWGSGKTYLSAAEKLSKSNKNIIFLLSLIYLKLNDTEMAVHLLLDLLNFSETKRDAKKVLDFVGKSENQVAVSEFIDIKVIPKLKKKIKFKIKKIRKTHKLSKNFIYGFFIIIFLLFVIWGGFKFYKHKKSNSRANIEALEISEEDKIVEFYKGKYKLLLSDKDVRKAFRKAKRAFNDFDDNVAQREINRILNSNASNDIKDKALELQRLIKEPDFKSMKTNYTFDEINKEPFMYENCYVNWKGRIVNLKIGKKNITFDFLVGYEDKKVLNGTVSVILDYGVKLYEDYPYEILGKIKLIDGKVYLQVVSLHRIVEL